MAEKTHAPDQSLIAPGCPIVAFAGREWFMPALAMRQSRVVVPGLMRLNPVLQQITSGQIAGLSEEHFENIIAIVHAALTRAYPTLTRDEFLDLPASTAELVAAIGVITRQSGFFNPVEGVAPGEAKGGTASDSTAPQPRSTDS
jgi:hypothetical protein